ncbi:ACD11-like protein [Mya arenaria]|uniref:ACD11-like protein n=1 Tax=Mya arenaria TaxID=6604 RepID=A0ABY7E591_MYAAR|nr:ACD11-like protein [Mya arenaria]
MEGIYPACEQKCRTELCNSLNVESWLLDPTTKSPKGAASSFKTNSWLIMCSVSLLNMLSCRTLLGNLRQLHQCCISKQACHRNYYAQSYLCQQHIPQINNVLREQEFPFACARHGAFIQEEPQLGNQYLEDPLLQSYLKRHVPEKVFKAIQPDLIKFGDRVAGEIYQLGRECEIQEPYLEHRVYGMAKLYLNCPSSGLYSCPLAMTDGAAKIIESLGEAMPSLQEQAFMRLTSRDPQKFWTSGHKWHRDSGSRAS